MKTRVRPLTAPEAKAAELALAEYIARMALAAPLKSEKARTEVAFNLQAARAALRKVIARMAEHGEHPRTTEAALLDVAGMVDLANKAKDDPRLLELFDLGGE